jgi:excisionase family DNA binding protein
MPDEILTLPEVAILLKVAEKTVYTMAQKAQLPAFKVRGQWRFKRDDLDRWIEQQKAVAQRGRKLNAHAPHLADPGSAAPNPGRIL